MIISIYFHSQTVSLYYNSSVLLDTRDASSYDQNQADFSPVGYLYCRNRPIGIMVWVFANGLEDRVSIPGQVTTKTQKMILYASLLNNQHYKVRIKGKWNNPGKGLAPSPTPRWSGYWKESLQVAHNYGRPPIILIFFIGLIKHKYFCYRCSSLGATTDMTCHVDRISSHLTP